MQCYFYFLETLYKTNGITNNITEFVQEVKMKATGIVRKIDDLGRVVIPKELRRSLRIREGDPLEIYLQSDGEIVLKKYALMEDLINTAQNYAEVLYNVSGFIACITDKEKIIAISGDLPKKDYLNMQISKHIQNVMDERAIWSTKDDNKMQIIKDDNVSKYTSQIIAPIICDADAIGTVILFSFDSSKKISNTEYKLVQSTSNFIAKQLET